LGVVEAMSAIARYWVDFAAWVKGRNRPLQFQTAQPIPVSSWVERKFAYAHAQKAHHGQREAYANLRTSTNAKLIEQIFADEAKCLRLLDTHHWLFSNPDAVEAAIKAIARKRVREARS
jgi:hypothetical protein